MIKERSAFRSLHTSHIGWRRARPSHRAFYPIYTYCAVIYNEFCVGECRESIVMKLAREHWYCQEIRILHLVLLVLSEILRVFLWLIVAEVYAFREQKFIQWMLKFAVWKRHKTTGAIVAILFFFLILTWKYFCNVKFISLESSVHKSKRKALLKTSAITIPYKAIFKFRQFPNPRLIPRPNFKAHKTQLISISCHYTPHINTKTRRGKTCGRTTSGSRCSAHSVAKWVNLVIRAIARTPDVYHNGCRVKS